MIRRVTENWLARMALCAGGLWSAAFLAMWKLAALASAL